MPKTSPRVSFGLYALEIKQDSAASAINLQPYSQISDLVTDSATSLPYATYEPDFWLLDGGYKFMPANLTTVHVGMMSSAMSGADGVFVVPPVLTVDFQSVHSTDGIVLRFMQYSGDYANSVKVQYYDALTILIREDTHVPTSTELSTNQAVTGFKKIVITFYSTNRPYRYLRLSGIDYGKLIYFQGADIKAASLVEDVDMIGGEARYNTFDVRIYSSDAAFSIINPTGYYAYLQQRQPISVHEIVDNQTVFMGQFYLQNWENKSDTEIELTCIDLLGVLDGITYRGGLWTGVALQTLIDSILNPIHIPYDLDATLATVQVIGWIPICSYRAALQQIAFAVGAYVDCSRSGSIKIYPAKIAASTPVYTTHLTNADKGSEESLSLKPIVTGVEVAAHNYVSVATSQQLYSGILSDGPHEITFSAPMHNLTITGATITSSGVNYALVSVPVTGTVTLNGQIYIDTTQVSSVYNLTLSANIKPNVLKVTDATLIHAGNVAAITQRVFDYYQQRYLQKVKLYASMIAPGDIVLVDTLYGKQIRASVEKMTTDLSGGMVSQVELTGVSSV